MMVNKPIIETMINTSALALTTLGVQAITKEHDYLHGYIMLGSGMMLEFLKYMGRYYKLW